MNWPGAPITGEDAALAVTVRLFAVLRERVGADTVRLVLPAGATVGDALDALARLEPLRESLGRMSVAMAVNRDYADRRTVLDTDDELALIPPLSGGSPELEMPVDVQIREHALSTAGVRKAVSDPSAGAVVVFEGVTREVAELQYEAYTTMAIERVEQIMRDCVRTHALCAAAVELRLGSVPLGEASVVIAVSAGHRAEAFAGAREAIDRIKAEAPIWKREVCEGGDATWVAGTPAPQAGEGEPPGQDADRPPRLSHVGEDGAARMVNVGDKTPSERVACARARVRMSAQTARAVQAGDGPKGEVLGVARIAGIQAAKMTASLIPLAHPLPLTFVDVSASVDVAAGLVELIAEARTVAQTGVEMEAMTACSVAALTVYDMVKGLQRGVELEQVVLLEKHGGRSDYRRED
jgi:MoaE-MoaD fusion protein